VGIVALCAVAAVVAVVGGTVLLSRHESTQLPGRPGKPVLQLEVDPTSTLGKAAKLLNTGHAAAAAAIFRRDTSPEAQLGLAFTEWTGPESLGGVKAIVAASPDDPALLLNLGWASYQAGRDADATNAWKETASRFPDSPYAIDALDVLHAGVAPGLPPILVDPAAVPAKARAALLAGVDLWQRKHVVSARRKFDEAARLAPDSSETLVAAAVAGFSPDQPRAPFPTLGPLSGRFPHDAIVRLHLGELLLWMDEKAKGKEQLRLAIAEQPKSLYARYARTILSALAQK
jgi:hypothetical protein